MMRTYDWKWDDERKADGIHLPDPRVAKRITAKQGNAAVFASSSLCRKRPNFRVRVLEIGAWIAIGVADHQFKVSGSCALGTQTHCMNSGYMNNKILMAGVESVAAPSIRSGDVIDVAIEFTAGSIFYFLNGQYQSHISNPNISLMEGELYACVDLSKDSAVIFNDEPHINLLLDADPRIEKGLVESYIQEQEELNCALNRLSVKTTSFEWKWSTSEDKKAGAIHVSEDRQTISRPYATSTINPAILTSLPLNISRPHIRFRLLKLSEWIAVGVTSSKMKLNDGDVLGMQSHCTNIGYVSQSGRHHVYMTGTKISPVSRIKEGDIVDIIVDFSHRKIFFWVNEQIQVCIHVDDLMENELYGCVSLSTSSEVFLRKFDDLPQFSHINSTPHRSLLPESFQWRWSTASSPGTFLDNSSTISRITTTGVTNPTVMASAPLCRQYPNFSIRINKLGSWIAVGVADQKFVLSGSAILGNREGSINSSYSSHQSSTIRVAGAPPKQAMPIAVNDIIDVAIDFDTNCIFYWLNQEFQGKLQLSPHQKLEKMLYPSVSLSAHSQVTFVDYHPPLFRHLTISGEKWKWSTNDKKKAKVIAVCGNLETAKRITLDGRNPAIISEIPFSESCPHFRVKVIKTGNWLGVGVCDDYYEVEDNVVLGSQTLGINSSYFCQATSKIRMHNEEVKDADRVGDGDVIDIAMDFPNDNIYYWLNGKLQGYIACKNHTLPSGSLYPCVNLSTGSEVEIRNNDRGKLCMPINIQKDAKKKIIHSVRRGNFLGLQQATRQSFSVVASAKEDLLFAALQGMEDRKASRKPNEQVIATASRQLIIMSHKFDKDCAFSRLPREILDHIMDLGTNRHTYMDILSFLVTELNVDINHIAVNSSNYYPLIAAACMGDLSLVESMIQWGADPSMRDTNSKTVMDHLVQKMDRLETHGDIEGIKNLLAVGEYLIKIKVVGNADLLVFASKYGMLSLIQIMVERDKLSVCVASSNDILPLVAAVTHNNTHIVNYILENGGKTTIDLKFQGKCSAKEIAKQKGYSDLLKLFNKYQSQNSTFSKILAFFGAVV